MSNVKLIREWDEYVKSIRRQTPVAIETPAVKAARISRLEKNAEEWFKFYFPKYYSSEPAEFHKRATRRFIKNKKWYEGRAWSRELAKSTRTMMEVLYVALVKKEIKNILYVSHNYDNAERLLMPIMLNLEHNQRLINDYGVQKGYKDWGAGKFITRDGVSFRAIGALQSPRGERNEEARPDCIIIDDIDNDEICKNPERVKKRWNWVERALIPTVSVSGNFRILFNGNIIAPDCTMLRAKERADYFEVINIRDKHGKSTWPQKNSEQDIDYILGKISYLAQQQEYFNNPIREGTVFEKVVYGKCPPLSKMDFVVAYSDPSYKKTGDYKATILIGCLNSTYYIYKAFVAKATIEQMIDWHYELDKYVGGKCSLYHYVEANGLQDVFYVEILLPRLKAAAERHGKNLSIGRDDRKKSEKFSRIESNLEPINRNGQLILNAREKESPHMKTLEEQFLAIEPKLSAHDDGPDAVEGGKWVIDNKLKKIQEITVGAARRKKYKY